MSSEFRVLIVFLITLVQVYCSRNEVLPPEDNTTQSPGNSTILIPLPTENTTLQPHPEELKTTTLPTTRVVSTLTRVLFRAPVIKRGPSNETERATLKVTFRCIVEGIPEPSLEWEKDGQVLNANMPNVLFLKNGNLRLKNISVQDAGFYRCKATNSLGSVYSTPAYLTVHVPATIRHGPSSYNVTYGTIVNLTCDVFGIPEPKIFWKQNGNVMRGYDKPLLTINVTMPLNYTCYVQNEPIGILPVFKSSEVAVITVADRGKPAGYCSVYKGNVCSEYFDRFDSMGRSRQHLLFFNLSYPELVSEDLMKALSSEVLALVSPDCRSALEKLLCHSVFPDCSTTVPGYPMPKPLCKEECVHVQSTMCSQEWPVILDSIARSPGRSQLLPDCLLLPSIYDKTHKGNPTCSLAHVIEATTVVSETTRTDSSTAMPEKVTMSIQTGSHNHHLITTVAITLSSLLMAIIVIVSIVCYRYHRSRQYSMYEFPKTFDVSKLPDNPMFQKPTVDKSLSESLKPLEYPRNNIIYIKDLGWGAFGRVFLAKAPNLTPGQDYAIVAVKMLKIEASEDMSQAFNREALLIAKFKHPNIVQLLGVCSTGRPASLILEYMGQGDLNEYLRIRDTKQRLEITSSGRKAGIRLCEQLSIAQQIASAMAYISERKFVHRDLATRNCLVSDNLTVKISDFGLARYVGSQLFYKGKDGDAIPIRWTAPEALLQNEFTMHSDIWSFGVLLWEVFTYALQPYYGITHTEVVQYVQEGRILPRPDNAPEEMYQLMKQCWRMLPADRPPFHIVHAMIRQLQHKFAGQEVC
ncbi:muscle, skeletal receptor tyrosine-protein kinase-like isoform X2 [Glandiceps talaboti]